VELAVLDVDLFFQTGLWRFGYRRR